MPTFGSISEYNAQDETFDTYESRLGEYFSANDITEATKKRAILNTVIGASNYKLIESAVSPQKPCEVTYERIIDLLKAHFQPVRSKIVTRYELNSRDRQHNESITTYVSVLRSMAKGCDYGDQLSDMLRDRLVCGVNHIPIQKAMLAKGDSLTLANAIQMAQAMEAADSSAARLSARDPNQQSTLQVDYIAKPHHQQRQQPQRQPQRQPQHQQHQQRQQQPRNCRNCGSVHQPRSCPAYGKTCNKCHKLNHYARLCRSKTSDHPIHTIEQSEDDQQDYYISEITDQCANNEATVNALVNGQLLPMKVDTGAKCNVMPLEVLHQIEPTAQIDNTTAVTLTCFGGNKIQSEGTVQLRCTIANTDRLTTFRIVDKTTPVILGLRDCLLYGIVSMSNDVHEINDASFTENIQQEYSDLFDNKIGTLPVTYHIKIDKNIEPVIRPPRKVPIAMKNKVIHELEHMTEMGVITPTTEPTEWVSSMVATHKKDTDAIRLCIDPRDLNKAIQRPHYPMRTIEEIAAEIDGATMFSTLDAKSSFWQVPLDQKSSMLTTFNTIVGRYRFLRMPYGINSGSEVFQNTIENLFANLPCFIAVDDIMVYGKTQEEHDENLKQILDRAREVNLKLNPAKCNFRVNEVTYLGHVFSKNGIAPDPKKVDSIVNMPQPEDVTAVQRFLGMVNYLAKYIPDLSNIAAPLRDLTRKDIAWHWNEQHANTFARIKQLIISAPTLRYYDARQPVTLTCDASKFGLGCACIQQTGPVAYASRTLTTTEQRYSQIEKELLAIVFACNRFRDYIYGQQITVETDHKPLLTILKKPMHAIPARLQRMRLQLHKYDLNLRYTRGTELFVADTLSRAPNSTTVHHDNDHYEVMIIERISEPKRMQLKEATQADAQLQQLSTIIQRGWPDKRHKVPLNIRTYFPFRDELTLHEDGVIMKGLKTLIPESLQQTYTKLLHEGHPGAEATKRRARDIVYWTSINTDIDRYVNQCEVCHSMAPHLQKEPLQSHEVPKTPFQTIGIDLFQWNGIDYLALGDAYSTWFDFCSLHTTTAPMIILKLKDKFTTHGIPQVVISDNAQQFVGKEFQLFSNEWNFAHITSSPRYPQSNGLAESAVKRAKFLLEKTKREGSDLHRNLLNLRNIPSSSALGSPAQRLMGRRLRTTVPIHGDLLVPKLISNVTETLQHNRDVVKRCYDKHAKPLRPLQPKEKVRVQTTTGHNVLGTIVKPSIHPRSYVVNINGNHYRRNRRHIMPVTEYTKLQQRDHQRDPQQDPFPFYEAKQTPRTPPRKLYTHVTTTRSGRVSRPNPRYTK